MPSGFHCGAPERCEYRGRRPGSPGGDANIPCVGKPEPICESHAKRRGCGQRSCRTRWWRRRGGDRGRRICASPESSRGTNPTTQVGVGGDLPVGPCRQRQQERAANARLARRHCDRNARKVQQNGAGQERNTPVRQQAGSVRIGAGNSRPTPIMPNRSVSVNAQHSLIPDCASITASPNPVSPKRHDLQWRCT